MNKTITVYELLRLVKDGKAPKKIKYQNYEYEFNQVDKEYQRWFNGLSYGLGEDRRLDIILDDEVEIIEDNDKLEKINVKTGDNCKRFIEYDDETGYHKYIIRLLDEYFAKNINKIIDHINKIEEKLDER